MKTLSLTTLIALLSTNTVFAGQVVYKSLYSQSHLVQGQGHDVATATQDAQSSIPSGYVADPSNSPESHCMNADGEMAPLSACANGTSTILTTIPVVKTR